MLRIVAAVQYCGNVDKLNDETMLKYENINLRKSDKNEIKTGNIVEQPVVVNITKVDKQL